MVNIIHNIDKMAEKAKEARKDGLRIGLVPTMGALHAGHISLIRKAASECDLTVVSIFVNPIQFDDKNDFAKYPKTLDSDALAAKEAGADIIFAPEAPDMYPEGFSTFVDMTGISDRLCGAKREAHFRGVCTVVTKLFNITLPERAYFGQKDAQQLAVVTKMTRELSMPIKIIGCPTIREDDGLAMSSRNARLGADERKAARCVYAALNEGIALFKSGETSYDELCLTIRKRIEQEPIARIDYIEIVDPYNFEPSNPVKEGSLATVAVYFGEVRLIDNIRF